MPRRDGTGPMGCGAMTGRGTGRNFVDKQPYLKHKRNCCKSKKSYLKANLIL